MYSGKQLKKLGKRLRGELAPDDIQMLNAYRRWFDPALLGCAFAINQALSENARPYLLSGRAKRTKSILRKLAREPNMDLSRMTDLVGLRIIVRSTEDQDTILDRLTATLPFAAVRDYRDDDRPYRAVHLHSIYEQRPLELQLRTLAQHVWADESEAFGEQVKEGRVPEPVAAYLAELREATIAIDASAEPPELITPFARRRVPISGLLSRLTHLFNELPPAEEQGEGTHLVVYDEILSSVTRETPYEADEREAALAEYERLMASLDQSRFSVLLLNTRSAAALRVTHPRFFGGSS